MTDRKGSAAAPRTQDAPEGWGALVVWRSLLLGGLGLALSTWIGTRETFGEWGVVVAAFVLWGALLGAVAWAVQQNGSGLFRVDLRLSFRGVDIVIALLFGVALRSMVVLAETVSTGMSSPQLPGLLLIDGGLSPVVWLLLIIFPVLVAPCVEELFFRGMLQPSLGAAAQRGWHVSRTAAKIIAIVGTAALFAACHLVMNPTVQPLFTLGFTFALGVVCGALSVWTGRLSPAIGTHLVFNASGVALLLFGTFG